MSNTEWVSQAAQFFADYATNKACGHTFLSEEVKGYWERLGHPEPHDARAWGLAAKKAAREGHVHVVGFGAAKTSNGSPKALWRARRAPF